MKHETPGLTPEPHDLTRYPLIEANLNYLNGGGFAKVSTVGNGLASFRADGSHFVVNKPSLMSLTDFAD
jgi:hypothetical protein